jgi:hypothetical protein
MVLDNNFNKITSNSRSPTPITLRSTLIKKIIFSQKNGPLCKKVVLEKYFKKLTPDSGSPTPITFG